MDFVTTTKRNSDTHLNTQKLISKYPNDIEIKEDAFSLSGHSLPNHVAIYCNQHIRKTVIASWSEYWRKAVEK